MTMQGEGYANQAIVSGERELLLSSNSSADFRNEKPVIEFFGADRNCYAVPVSHKFSLNDSFLMELLLVIVRFGNACLMARV
jgi:hypothetical protein